METNISATEKIILRYLEVDSFDQQKSTKMFANGAFGVFLSKIQSGRRVIYTGRSQTVGL